jgi:indolepyruvate ferredoxin oxidoreductase alpha subunit
MNAILQPVNVQLTQTLFSDGNQAIAMAALDAGVAYMSHYPGSPLNRVVDGLLNVPGNSIIVNHALNEHIAALSAMGASLSGARSLVVMKHVGLNIAADPLNYAGVTQMRGGMVVVVGTDPGARTSTGEEDVHWYAPQFNFPLLEPTSVQSVYDCVLRAYDIAEQVQTPVLVFVPGRLAYQSARIERQPAKRLERQYAFHKNPETLINVGQRAVRNHRLHIERMQAYAQQASSIRTEFKDTAVQGVITRGATYSVVNEVIRDLHLEDKLHLLNIEQTFPLNVDALLAFCKGKAHITIIEDQDGFLETMLKRDLFGQVQCQMNGKQHFPAWGEITDQQVRDYFVSLFGLKVVNTAGVLPANRQIPERPGTFCEGCPHRAAFFAIDRALESENGIIGGDIGCSSLPPHRTDWLLCMNAGIGISQGIAQLLPAQAMVSSGGEGSLFHGGLTSLQSAVENKTRLVHVLFDNASIAMTGHQDSPTTHNNVDVRKLLESIGVRAIFEVEAFDTRAVQDAITHAQQMQGVKVVWVRGQCALLPTTEMLQRRQRRTLYIDNTRCEDCDLCYRALQCPAIVREAQSSLLHIDLHSCRRCAACLSVCPHDAIVVKESAPEVTHA